MGQSKQDDDDADPVKLFKNTPFAECVLPYDVFHMNRRTKNTIN
jgi:hypothetical protein